MLTQNEISSLSLSPTKKDFVQIWNELLEVAGKLSERWDPTSTNESDPGIVILKAIVGIADKLNYSIDKNILEAFMPTAAQEDSMRKLCEMLGYSIKYYQSAMTDVTIKYYNSNPSTEEAAAMVNGLQIPKFTTITNSDKDISYFTINETPVYISSISPSKTITCMEGQIVKCESVNDNNVINVNQISENNRFYLPETQIAENGIFIYNVFSDDSTKELYDGTPWKKVDNLNVQRPGAQVYKFGFDSYESRPYIEFPEDYSELFSDGIFIYYTRTNGVNGNISPKTLTQLELPNTIGWSDVAEESFNVENTFSATTGSNVETIKQAYNNFKKTVGTFETLVTCRDYMNKIYSMLGNHNKPLVSNILVTDIRNDLNRAITICSCDDAGILYKETPLIVGTKYGELRNDKIYTKTTYTDYDQVGNTQYSDYTQDGEPIYTDYVKVGETEFSEYEQTELPSYTDYEQVGDVEYSDYEQLESTFSDFEQVGDAKYSDLELMSTEISEPEQLSVDTQETYIASEANKPKLSSTVKTSQYCDFSQENDPILCDRITCWYIGDENSAGKIYLYADEYGSDWIPSEYLTPDPTLPVEEGTYFKSAPSIIDYDENGQPVYEEINLGTVSAYDSEGNRSDFWLINQNGNTYETLLPINWIKSTNTTIVNQQLKTVTNKVTETIEKQRTETVKEQRTATVKKQRTETIKEQRTATVKEQRTETIREQRTGIVEKERTKTVESTVVNKQEVVEERAIDNFDIVFYPFKAYNQIKSNVKNIRSVYESSFKYDADSVSVIEKKLEADTLNTISHNIKQPRIGDVVSINNYLRLSATIATNSKVTEEEGNIIKDKIKIALANAFNMRELDFGEEIPFDSLIDVIEKADSKIRVASLNEPALYTTFSVLDGTDVDGNPVIHEYAVASTFLTEKDADAADRFYYEDEKEGIVGTFNTVKAKEYYNKMVVRNVLAGRIPLFKYNEVFKTNFSEGAYQVTEVITDILNVPTALPKPTAENPFTIWSDNGVIYTGLYNGKEDNGEEKAPTYKKTYTPDIFKDNIITEVKDNAITSIDTNLKINATTEGNVSDVTLAAGEYIRFRAPNLTTLKTYPAYVNYHLSLNSEYLNEANAATAQSLFELLDDDNDKWSLDNSNTRWQKVFDHFNTVDYQSQTSYLKKFKLEQKISAYSAAAATDVELCSAPNNESGQHVRDSITGKCKYCGIDMVDTIHKGPIIINIGDTSADDNKESAEDLLADSGCLKLLNNFVDTPQGTGFKANLTWTPSEGETAPSDSAGPELEGILVNFANNSPFITSKKDLDALKTEINNKIESLRGQTLKDGVTPALPTECSWTISFEFACVPFVLESLNEWDSFIKAKSESMFGFKPVVEGDVIFWRTFEGGYAPGKYVLQNGEKLLKFERNYFKTVSEAYSSILNGIYLIRDIGKDAQPAIIKNNEERVLKRGERLYVEYTPSSVTDDGTTQEQESVTEILGEGTIIRPRGFETGLVDSSVSAAAGNSAYKTVTFRTADNGTVKVDMQRFGANEQVEVRDYSRVELSSESLSSHSSAINIYKNFNGCDELEKLSFKDGKRINNTYTLKDGEYIFYTDNNKAELAYFSTGTQITLLGRAVLPKFDIIDLTTIFDSGLKEIPWKYLYFSDNDKIVFQEYQYLTLGPEDTLNNLTLKENLDAITGDWQYCDDVVYSLAGSTNDTELSALDIYTDTDTNAPDTNIRGNGWQVSSTLELDVSPSSTQTLRKTDKVEASLRLSSVSASGVNVDGGTLDINPDYPLSFKTNLACQTTGGKITIDDVNYNPNKLKGFELKVFTADEPAVVKTEPGTTVPARQEEVTDIVNWKGHPLTTKDHLELWSTIDLADIKVDDGTNGYDNALRIPFSLLPDTYGILCIYINYTSDDALNSAKTWIELLPGSMDNDISLLNVEASENTWLDAEEGINKSRKFLLKPGINCLRINKTSRIFIKTSEDSQGILYFDDLKLVDCKPVEYSVNGVTDKMSTHGLNIDQLGYLNLNEVTSIDKDMIKKLVTDCVNNTYTELLDLERKTTEVFSTDYSKLTDIKVKLKNIVDIAEEAKKETDALLVTYDDGYDINTFVNALFDKYIYLNNALSLERALLKALDENKDADDLEQQLITILNSFSTVETAQQQMLVELSELKKLTLDSISDVSFTDKEVLADFSVNSKAADFINDVKDTCVSKVNEYFAEQLGVLANDIDKVANSEERAKLVSTFEALETAVAADTRKKILAAVNKLEALLEDSSALTLIESAYTCAVEADFTALATALMQLNSIVYANDVKLVLAELETAAAEAGKDEIVDLLTDLIELFDTHMPEISTQINKLLGEVEAAIASNAEAPSSDINRAVKAIHASLLTVRNSARDEILSDIRNFADDLEATGYKKYSTALQNLESSRDLQVTRLLSELAKLEEQRINDVIAIDSSVNTVEGCLNAPFGHAAILDVWPKHMIQLAVDGVEALYSELSKIIINIDDDAELVSPFTTDILSSIANEESFLAIYNKVDKLAQQHSQNIASSEFIEAISKDVLAIPSDMVSAMQSITNEGSTRNLNLLSIINSLSNLSLNTSAAVVKKQQLLADLREELNKTITLDKQLFDIIAKLLCPSITLFSANKTISANDDFYSKFAAFVKDLENSLLISTDHYLTLKDIKAKLNQLLNSDGDLSDVLVSANAEQTATWLSKLDTSTYKKYSVLPDDYINTLFGLKGLVDMKKDLAISKEAEFFDNSFFENYTVDTATSELIKNAAEKINSADLRSMLYKLSEKVNKLENTEIVTNDYKDVYSLHKTEEQLLADIRKLDRERAFYYSAPINTGLAIELNNSTESLNTLMNPATNYDINNINNCFVISKLDMDYLDNGIQIARSSRLN